MWYLLLEIWTKHIESCFILYAFDYNESHIIYSPVHLQSTGVNFQPTVHNFIRQYDNSALRFRLALKSLSIVHPHWRICSLCSNQPTHRFYLMDKICQQAVVQYHILYSLHFAVIFGLNSNNFCSAMAFERCLFFIIRLIFRSSSPCWLNFH